MDNWTRHKGLHSRIQSENALVGKSSSWPLSSEISQEGCLCLVPKTLSHMPFSETPACIPRLFTRYGRLPPISQDTVGMAWTLAWPAEYPTVTKKREDMEECEQAVHAGVTKRPKDKDKDNEILRLVECLRAETLEPTSLGSNFNSATSRLGELGWLASFLCASISSSGKWANSNCTSEGCCTNEASRCAQNTGYMGSINTSVLIIYREAE